MKHFYPDENGLFQNDSIHQDWLYGLMNIGIIKK